MKVKEYRRSDAIEEKHVNVCLCYFKLRISNLKDFYALLIWEMENFVVLRSKIVILTIKDVHS